MSVERGKCELCERETDGVSLLPYYDMDICHRCRGSLVQRRTVAAIIDVLAAYAVMLAAVTAAAIVGVAVGHLLIPKYSATVDALGNGLVVTAWLTKDAWFGGRSIGKLVCHLRVVEGESGRPIGLARSVKRNLPTLIPFAALAMLFDIVHRNSARMGDGWARTKVIPS